MKRNVKKNTQRQEKDKTRTELKASDVYNLMNRNS